MASEEKEFGLGEGPAVKASVSLRAGNIRAVRERVGARGFSVYVDAAVERQIKRDLLEEALQANEEASGPIPQALRDEAADLFRAVKGAPELQGGAEWAGHEAG
ncbi:hypothetical protein E1200_33305 [Actinomadura sp. GC306]|uniref:hypothetical protein n=1 Tax=Actinomadura sp. GC306 TaxID=2530367 RepID=UPI001052C407|nr:hypothetical protein [Actinomadura sp. GC306]TDC57894.1 hypothetical protein E1200_33305 [Actinomadura sp. GC306]